MRQDRQERPEYSSFHTLAPSSLGPEGGNPSFYPDNPHYTEVTSAPQPFQSRMVGGLGSAHKKGEPLKVRP